jgi:hypothetical protein
MEVETTIKDAFITLNKAFSFRKGQLAKVTESLAEYHKDLNIYPLKFILYRCSIECGKCRWAYVTTLK